MKLISDQLRAVGQTLYGPAWQSPLAEALGVTDRTIRRWAKGEYEIPEGIAKELANVCRTRSIELERLAEKLSVVTL